MIVWTITTPFYIRLQNHHYSLFTINNVFFGRKSEKRLQIILHRSINFTNFAHDDIQADTKNNHMKKRTYVAHDE